MEASLNDLPNCKASISEESMYIYIRQDNFGFDTLYVSLIIYYTCRPFGHYHISTLTVASTIHCSPFSCADVNKCKCKHNAPLRYNIQYLHDYRSENLSFRMSLGFHLQQVQMYEYYANRHMYVLSQNSNNC
jgi:hypothetical protein